MNLNACSNPYAKDIKVHFITKIRGLTNLTSSMPNLLFSDMGAFSEFEKSFYEYRVQCNALVKKREFYKG